MGKLNFADISPEVNRRIVAFLNCAKTATDIAGFEPQTGPVLDDPTTGPGDQVRDYDIGKTVAKRILERRGTLPDNRFTDIVQIDFITGLGQDKLDDLAYSFGETFYGTCRNVYLRIETIESYSPVEPQAGVAMAPIEYRRDCIRNTGHEEGTIPDQEVKARTITALVYSEYLDADYLVPKTDKLINTDVNEPLYDRRVPGTVIYAHPGETLCIHVFNADTMPHSFHVHGVEYGPDSDGAYPLGTLSSDGRRSDEICPGQSWTYIFKVREEHIGCWPFHDHYRHAAQSIERGLFGGLVVLPEAIDRPKTLKRRFKIHKNLRADLADYIPRKVALRGRVRDFPGYKHLLNDLHEFVLGDWVRPPMLEKVHHVPVFFHIMNSNEGSPLFDSGDLPENTGVFEHFFGEGGTFSYFCRFHSEMTGTVNVIPGGAATTTVNIVDSPEMGFSPATVDIGVGGTVRWENHSEAHHTVTEAGAVMPSHSINGRAFVGNSPTVEVETGDTIRWYVFNLDLGSDFHNFHTHNIRWEFAGENLDVRVLSPAESFCIEAKAPSVVLLNPKIEALQKAKKRPKNAKEFTFVGEFLFHCHVHHHFRMGMAGLVRAKHKLWLTPELACELQEDRGLRLYTGDNLCPPVELDRCEKSGEGEWLEVPGDPRVAMMHACLLPNTSKVLYFGYENRYSPDEAEYSWLWDEVNGYHMTNNQVDALTAGGYTKWSLWSGEHTFLDDTVGTLLIHGGYRDNVKKAYTFDPGSELWSTAPESQYGRFYATTITLADGKAATLFGSNLFGPGGTSKNIEVYDPAGGGSWEPAIPFPSEFDNHQYYPWTFLLPDGQWFIAGPHTPSLRFDPSDPTTNESFPQDKGNRSSGGEKGTAVMFTLRPPDYDVTVMIIGGDLAGTEQTSETIDLSQPSPTWHYGPELDLNVIREWQCHSVLLPDGRVFLCGGIESGPHGGASEIFDPENPLDEWKIGPVMQYYRTYHSSALLLADGSVLAGGDDPKPGTSEPTPHERYLPDYFNAPRPQITVAGASTIWGASFDIETPQATLIAEVALLRPGAATHGWNMSQRRVELEITGVAGNTVTVQMPPNGNVAPPGWYLLFILDGNRVPSQGHWVRLTTP